MAMTPSRAKLVDLFPAIGEEYWGIDPHTTFLNHGSFGACPKPVLAEQHRLRVELEANPLRFLCDVAPELLGQAKARIARLLNAPDEDVVFVQSATAGVNAVLRSIDLKPDDEILVLDRGYRACLNVLAHVCKRTGAKAVAATLPWPTSGPDEVVASIMRRVTGNTRLAMIDHINSDTGLVLPIAQIVERLNDAGIDVLVDGAHTLGQVEIDISSLSAAYFVSNCHKWLCGPKAAAVLYVRPDRQQGIEPVIISHGSRVDASGKYGSIQDRFAWQGTFDPTPAICAGTASAFLSTLMPGGLKELMQRNHAMAVAWRGLCCERWSINAPCPDEMIGAMAALPICPGFHDDDRCSEAERFRKFIKRLRSEDRIECQPRCFGDPPTLHIRLSCHAYNRGSQVQSVMECMSSWAKEKGR